MVSDEQAGPQSTHTESSGCASKAARSAVGWICCSMARPCGHEQRKNGGPSSKLCTLMLARLARAAVAAGVAMAAAAAAAAVAAAAASAAAVAAASAAAVAAASAAAVAAAAAAVAAAAAAAAAVAAAADTAEASSAESAEERVSDATMTGVGRVARGGLLTCNRTSMLPAALAGAGNETVVPSSSCAEHCCPGRTDAGSRTVTWAGF